MLKSIATTLCALLVAGCDDKCENGFKIKKEYTTIFYHESWHMPEKDTLLDGAIRTETYAYKGARSITVRCFQSASRDYKMYDIRYSIDVPLLVRVVPEIEKAGPVEFVVSIDGVPAGSVPARIIAQKASVNFLGRIEPALLEKFNAAKKSLIVMPRQANTHLDDVTEFGVTKLAEHLVKVKEACASLHDAPAKPAQPPSPQTTKKT